MAGMSRWVRRRGPVCLMLAILALCSGGCLWVAAGCAGGAALGYAYSNGKLCQCYAASLDDTWAAARTALQDLGMPLDKEKRDRGILETHTSDGEKVIIRVHAEPSKIPVDGPITRVCVRVALFGDHPVSARVLDQIGAHLVPVAGPGQMATPQIGAPIAPPPPVGSALPPPRPVTPPSTEPPLGPPAGPKQ